MPHVATKLIIANNLDVYNVKYAHSTEQGSAAHTVPSHASHMHSIWHVLTIPSKASNVFIIPSDTPNASLCSLLFALSTKLA